MFGCIPATEEEKRGALRRFPLSGLVGSAPVFAPAVDHTPLLDMVYDQGRSSACVSSAASTAIYLAGQAQGAPVKRPSIRWGYDVARYMRTPGVLEDKGSSFLLLCLGYETHGIVAEERWPFNAARINEPPPFDLDMAGADAKFGGYYATTSNGELRRALERGHFPCVAINVYANFLGWGGDGSVYDAPEGEFLGRHMLACVGYRPGAILIVNSWSTGWGMGGFAWLSDRFLASPDCFEKWVVSAAPASR